MPLVPLSLFNPKAGSSSIIDPVSRLRELQASWNQYPGRVPGGTGLTGLSRWDESGWRQMLEEQQEAMRLSRYLSTGGRESQLDTDLPFELGSTRTPEPATGKRHIFPFGTPASLSGAALQGLQQVAAETGEWGATKRSAGQGRGQSKLRVEEQRGGPYAVRPTLEAAAAEAAERKKWQDIAPTRAEWQRRQKAPYGSKGAPQEQRAKFY